MPMTLNVTSGNQVEGVRLEDPLINELMANLNDQEKAQRLREFTQFALAMAIALKTGLPIDQAANFVVTHSSVID